MNKDKNKLFTKEIIREAVIGSFKKLNPKIMIENPVMFVVEIGFFLTLLLTFFPHIFGETGNNLALYNGIVSFILFITLLFAKTCICMHERMNRIFFFCFFS